MSDDDAELVALIDNELDESRRTALLARLATDERLRQRYEELRQTGAPLAASFDALLEQAPVARLRAALPADKPVTQPPRRFAGIALRQLAAGIVIGLLAAGAIAWAASIFGLFSGKEDWRSAVAEYMEFYTNETFALPNPDRDFQAKKLSVVAERVGANLTPESVALPGLRFESAYLLSYDGTPLGEIVYVDAHGSPVLFCIIANGGADTPNHSERRGDLALSSWSHGGRGYLMVGRAPEQQVAELAQTLKARF